MRWSTSWFRRVRSHFVPSINSNHRRPPQRSHNEGSPASRLHMYVHIGIVLGRSLCLSFSPRPSRRLRPRVRFYLSAVITPVTGIENWIHRHVVLQYEVRRVGAIANATWAEFQTGLNLFCDACLFIEVVIAIRTDMG